MERPFRDHALSCVNHVGTGGSACPKCGVLYCAECLPLMVNGAAWCELCANELKEDVKPRLGMAFLVGGAGCLLTTLVWLFQALFLNTRGIGFPFLLFFGYPFAIYAGFRSLKSTTGEPPRIELRRR